MIFDYELMFIDDKNNTQKNITSGILGETLDLVGEGQGKGFPAVIVIAFSSDTTATADPAIQFAIETADNSSFTNSLTIPMPLPVPLKKADLTAGTVLPCPLPKVGLKRYVRLKLGCDSAITCMGIKAGFVLDAPEK